MSSGPEAAGPAAAACKEPPGNVYLQSYSFNQDGSCFVCCTTAGFRVYTTSPVCEVHRREHAGAFEGRSTVLAEMLFKTNIFAMVTLSEADPGSGGLNKVQIWNDQAGRFAGELRSRNEVRGIAMRRDVIAMVCEYAIYVYTLDKLRVIQHLTTSANLRGLCVLASSSEPWILCCPGQTIGAVRVQVGQDDRATHVFEAHQTPLVALAINAAGSLVATASEKGTVVKVFQRTDGQLLYRLRRSARPVDISCVAFRHDDRFLAVASCSSSTVHIFKLDSDTARPHEDGEAAEAAAMCLGAPAGPAAGAAGASPAIQQICKVANAIASHAPDSVTDAVKGVMPTYFNDLRSFATFRIPDSGCDGRPTVDARGRQARVLGPMVSFHRTEPMLSVLHYSGILYEVLFKPDHDPAAGGQECRMHSAVTWFAVRPEFKVQTLGGAVPTEPGGTGEPGEEGAGEEENEDWQLL